MGKPAKAKVVNKVVQEVQMEQTAVVLDSEALNIVNEFFSTRTLANELAKRQKDLEAQVKTILGDAEVGIYDGKVRIERDIRERENLDKKLLMSAFPEAYEAVVSKKPYVVLVAK